MDGNNILKKYDISQMQDCDMDGFVNGNNRQKYQKVTYCSENINLWQNRYVLFKSHGN